jgi:hypothetical protein
LKNMDQLSRRLHHIKTGPVRGLFLCGGGVAYLFIKHTKAAP